MIRERVGNRVTDSTDASTKFPQVRRSKASPKDLDDPVCWVAMRAEQAQTQVEDVGRELRSHMGWIKPSF